jgi:hypothetical protein
MQSETRGRSRSESVQKALNDPRLSASLTDIAKEGRKSPARLQFEKKVKRLLSLIRYYYQLLTGCQKDCNFKLCFSNTDGPRLTPETAAVTAVQLASYSRNLFCPRIPTEPDIQFTAFSLSPFSTPYASPAHSRTNSKSNMNEESEPKPFLHSVLSSTAFSSLFGVQQNTKNTLYNSSIPNITELTKSFGDLVKRQRSATTSDLNLTEPESAKNLDGRIALKKLDCHLLEIAVETYRPNQDNGDPTFLLNTIESVFSSISALSQSFLVLLID